MKLQSFRVKNFRRLQDVRVDLDEDDASIFVGANNSGKTSATHVFKRFLRPSDEPFSIFDFSAECWKAFEQIGEAPAADIPLPIISLDLWFKIAESDLHKVIKILPSLNWTDIPVGIRLEYAPKDRAELIKKFSEARAARSPIACSPDEGSATAANTERLWPRNLREYLQKRLTEEYHITYFVLDREQFDGDLKECNGYTPDVLGDTFESGASILKSLLRVDFVDAQRHLSDDDDKRSSSGISKQIADFYQRNLKKPENNINALGALMDAQEELDKHLEQVFAPTLENLNTFGYPGNINPRLVIKASLEPENILKMTQSAGLHYTLRDPGDNAPARAAPILPDQYNGLGFKNLIHIVVRILDYRERWKAQEEQRQPLHVIFIEEPEAHLHVQLQQTFIRQIWKLIEPEESQFFSQMVITTHSPHIIYEKNLKPVRYFRRIQSSDGYFYSEVLNLAHFNGSRAVTDTPSFDVQNFLMKYMKLTHCDLFFADAAILVEGNVERLLLPLMISKEAKKLKGNYLSILELGGAFAYVFENLIQFLGIPTLIITDVDSVTPQAPTPPQTDDAAEDGEDADADGGACMAHIPEAETSNITLRNWIPKLKRIAELLDADLDYKICHATADKKASICVAYQTRQPVTWGGDSEPRAGRTLEEAFAFENLEWCQQEAQKDLQLCIPKNSTRPLDDLLKRIHKRVRSSSFNKTNFALALMTKDEASWNTPQYIKEGLLWLETLLHPPRNQDSTTQDAPQSEEPVTGGITG